MDSINIDSLYTKEMYNTSKIVNQQKKIEHQAQKIDKTSKLYEVCQDFEAIFIKQMLDVMRKTVNKSGLISGGFAEEMFEDMLYDEYAKNMAKNAQFGLSDTMYHQLSKYGKI